MRKVMMAAFAATMLCGSAHAVVYAFLGSTNSDPTQNQSFTLNYTGGFITTNQTFTAAQLTTSYNISSVQFCPVGTGCGNGAGGGSPIYTAASDSVYVITAPGAPVTLPDGTVATPTGVGLEFDFRTGALTNTGVFSTADGTSSDPRYNFNHQGLLAVGVPLPAVPEPATWAMMIVGFGLIGTAMRRRKIAISFA